MSLNCSCSPVDIGCSESRYHENCSQCDSHMFYLSVGIDLLVGYVS